MTLQDSRVYCDDGAGLRVGGHQQPVTGSVISLNLQPYILAEIQFLYFECQSSAKQVKN